MNRSQIGTVTSSWERSTEESGLLLAAIVERLTGSLGSRARRARWIIEAVTLLAPNLDRPARFSAIAGDLLRERIPVTVQELEVDRAALLGAVDALAVPELGDDARAAWQMAINLFAAIVESVCLDPFGDAESPTTGPGGSVRP
jgi:hypothetical protein